MGLKFFLENHLGKRIEHDEDGLASLQFTFVRTGYGDESRSVVVDARIFFSRPVLASSGTHASWGVGNFQLGPSREYSPPHHGLRICAFSSGL